MRVTDEWLAMVDGRRGGETRGAFVKGLVEGALGGSDGGTLAAGPVAGVVKGVRPRPAPAVTRAAGGSRVHSSPALERFGRKS